MNTIKKKFKTAILDLCRWYWTHFTFKSQKCNEHFLKIFNTLTLQERLDYIYQRHAVGGNLFFQPQTPMSAARLKTKEQVKLIINNDFMYGFILYMVDDIFSERAVTIFEAGFSHKTDQWPVYEYYLRKN